MTQKTKYELWQEKDAEIKKREENIERLKSLQERITSLKAVIPVSSSNYEENNIVQEERAFIDKMNYDIQQLMESEQGALSLVENPYESEGSAARSSFTAKQIK